MHVAREHGIVPEDVPLDAFVEEDTADEPKAPPDGDGVEPTAEFRPDGVICPNCETTVERRWSTAEGSLCIDCVEW